MGIESCMMTINIVPLLLLLNTCSNDTHANQWHSVYYWLRGLFAKLPLILTIKMDEIDSTLSLRIFTSALANQKHVNPLKSSYRLKQQ